MITQIRDYLHTLICSETSFTSANVFKGRYMPANLEQLPLISIRFQSLDRERASMGGEREFLVTASWDVVIYTKSGTTIDTALDSPATAVQEAIRTDRHLGGLVHDAFVTSIAYNANETGEDAVGEATVSLQIEYSEQ